MTTRLKAIPRSSETELHLMGNLLERNGHLPFYATLKMDGFSMSLGNVNGEFVASARERMIDINEDSAFADAFRVGAVHAFPDNVILQGELVGPGIRGNPMRFDDVRFFAFDLIVAGKPAGLDALREFCTANGFAMVPLIATDFTPSREACLMLAKSTSGEGAVFRPMREATDEFQGRVSFKVFNPSYAHHH